MSSPVPSGGLPAHEASVDWDDLSGLDRILAIYQLGPNTVVVETKENRQIRITAWFDRRGGRYVADFERRTDLVSGGKQVRVWAHTHAYPPCESADLVGCLEAAVVEVDRLIVY